MIAQPVHPVVALFQAAARAKLIAQRIEDAVLTLIGERMEADAAHPECGRLKRVARPAPQLPWATPG